MKTNRLYATILTLVVSAGFTGTSLGQTPVGNEAPSYKMTTPIPSPITTPDQVETPIGALEFFDGIPIGDTTQTVYDYVDRARAVHAFITMMPSVATYSLREGNRDMGASNSNQILIWEQLGDSKSLVLTYNNTSLYTWGFLDLKKDGPTVIELPPGVLGILDDMDMRYLSDMGAAGPDKGKGGKYLVLPPGYDGPVPSGYFVVQSPTYCVWNFMRGYVEKGVEEAADRIKKGLKVYSLASKDNPPEMEFINMSGVHYNTIPPGDYSYFECLNAIIQEEAIDFIDPETRGMIAALGIVKGQPFNPTGRMRRLLSEAAVIGNAYARANTVYPRDPGHRVYKDSDSEWLMAYPDKDCFFLKDGARRIDGRLWMHYNAVCITPAMALTKPGAGSDYMIAGMDSEHKPLYGAKAYKLHLPPNPPMKDNWSVTIYDPQTRSMLQTDQPFAGISSLDKGLKTNSDGSMDIIFGPEAPKGMENNWIQTIPGKSWFIILRAYGPLEPWIDRSWRPSELMLME